MFVVCSMFISHLFSRGHAARSGYGANRLLPNSFLLKRMYDEEHFCWIMDWGDIPTADEVSKKTKARLAEKNEECIIM